MKKLYLVRHGQSVLNVKGNIAGTTETPLTDEGRAQAKATGIAMKEANIHPTFIVSSPLSRAVETAEIIAKQLGIDPKTIHQNALFAERHYGELENKPWSPDLNLDGISDIETEDTIIERAKLALEWLENITKPDDIVLVVSHGGYGRVFRGVAMNINPFDYSFKLSNAELVALI